MVFFPSLLVISLSIGEFDIAIRLWSNLSEIENTDLNSGSSKHGKALLASVLSNCVVPILCSIPWLSRYLER